MVMLRSAQQVYLLSLDVEFAPYREIHEIDSGEQAMMLIILKWFSDRYVAVA